jgi:hypothetical protein
VIKSAAKIFLYQEISNFHGVAAFVNICLPEIRSGGLTGVNEPE